MPDWSIKIVAAGRGKAAFVPDIQGAQAGDPLKAQQDDLVTWNNTTKKTHQPWQTDENYKPYPDADAQRGSAEYLSDPIPPGESSRPSYDVAQPASSPPLDTWTVYYYCKNHPNSKTERGTIIATVVPTS
jgi:hypothetical protein